jgi:hypothetical protein
MKTIAVLFVAAASTAAFAEETTGPGAKLTKLSDRWVSVQTEAKKAVTETKPAVKLAVPAVAAPAVIAAPVAKIPTAVAPLAATSSIPGYTPDSNYSGACHVTVDLNNKSYKVNSTSSNGMVFKQPTNAVCLPTEKLAIDYGFKKSR